MRAICGPCILASSLRNRCSTDAGPARRRSPWRLPPLPHGPGGRKGHLPAQRGGGIRRAGRGRGGQDSPYVQGKAMAEQGSPYHNRGISMHIHEYQAKRLLSAYGVPTPEGRLAATPEKRSRPHGICPARCGWSKRRSMPGGRGKAGGVKVCRSPEEAREAAASLLGARLVTPQTGPDGERVNAVWIERGTASARECYLAVALDRASQCLTVMASPGGGMDIEAVAASSPERVFTARLDGRPLPVAFSGPEPAGGLGAGVRPGAGTGLSGAEAGGPCRRKRI